MFRNYLKLAFRNLSRQKAFSIINITGLAVGLASSLTILLWVQDEVSYDRFNLKADRTYRITAAASSIKVAFVPVPFGPALQEAVPEVVHNTRIWREGGVLFQKDNLKFDEPNTFYAEPSFFDVFDFELLHGDKKTALNDVRSVVISEATAIKYFGTTDVLGKTITKRADEQFNITGVFKKPNGNSHIQPDILLPWMHLATWNENVKGNNWGNYEVFTYIVFDSPKDEAYLAGFTEKLEKMYSEHDELDVKFGMQPLTDIHLHSQFMGDMPGHGSYQYVAALSVIAIVIVLIGCINFMNLSTARSARRAKEVGLRKVAGAARTQLVRQFLGESIVITLLSLVVALLLVAIMLPRVNELVGKQLSLNLADPWLLVGITVVAVVTGIVSGIYPAIVLSGFTPVKVLKKDVKSGVGGSIFRNVLVVTQFTVSIVLLVGTVVIYQQLSFMRSRDLGYDKENLLYLSIQGWDNERIPRWRAAFQARAETANVTFANALPTDLASGTGGIEWQGKDPNKQILFATMTVDDNFITVFNMKMVAGRNFTYEMRGDTSNIMINEAAASVMGFTPETAVGQPIDMWGSKGQIVGVIKDFNFKPLREAVEPMIVRANTWGNTVIIKAEAGKVKETISAMQDVWNSKEALYPFSYNFLDQDLENLYKSERQVSTLFTVFSVLAILISCLGLYGLSAFIAEQRTREIGIRKALGASTGGIVYLLNTRFIVPIIVSMLIAAPVSWYTMNQWLEDFAYKINFNWGLVALAGLLALAISLITVSYESIKAASINPVKSLRSE
jgi:putative ABC transport system permease protein